MKMELNKRYLVKFGLTSLCEVIVLELTNTHVKLQHENNSTSWKKLVDVQIEEELPKKNLGWDL